jgi:Large polyvalent protein associated domain 38
VSEAAAWARGLDRSKIKPSGGVRLNMMIPLDEIPDAVINFFGDMKGMMSIPIKDFYRNEKIWKQTGFWLGQDGRWRYELKGDKAKFNYFKIQKLGARLDEGKHMVRLVDVLDYPELFKALPELRSVILETDEFAGRTIAGKYLPDSNTILLKYAADKDILWHELQHAINDFVGSRFKGTNIEESGLQGYWRDPGEMEARLATERMKMSDRERKVIPPWETLEDMIYDEGLTRDSMTFDNTKMESGLGRTLYSGDPLLEKGAEAIVAAARRGKEYIEQARAMKQFKPALAAKMIKEEFVRSFVDRSGNIRTDLLNVLGEQGYRIVQKMYLAKGASSISANMLRQMRKEVYKGLDGNEKRVLDSIIHHRRMVDLAKYKDEKDFKYFKEHPIIESVGYLETFPTLEKITPEKAADLFSRSDRYFEWMKVPLKDMLDAQLISQQEYDNLIQHNYQRKELVDVYDKRYQTKVGTRKRTVYDSGVESLARGRQTDIFEPSSEILALEVFNRAYGRIMNNRANLELLNVARSTSENPFVRIKEQKGDRIPSGWNRVFVYEGGQRKALYLSPEMSKEWIITNPEVSYRYGQLLRHASGSSVLRTFATGINWGFALANLPRDVMHTWFTARMFNPKTGKWEGAYSPFLPHYAMQMGADLSRVFLDAALKKGRYEDYIKEGGGMEFLVHQGRLFQRGKHIDSSLTGIYDFMGYFGETSEVMTRLAIRDRVIRRRANKLGITYEKAKKNKDITTEATFAARDYMDFGQGGSLAKALDNGIPYLNAAIQGTRGMFSSFKPGSGTALSSTFKLAQFAALTTGMYIANKKRCPETMKSLVGDVNAANNLIIPLGDSFGFMDAQGQMRYPYLKIPLDPGQKFFKTFFEAAADKWLGNEVDVDRVTRSLRDFSPVGTSPSDILPPTISGPLGYMANKDFWLNEDIWRQTDRVLSWPNSAEEYTKRTPQAYIDFGKVTGMSPERTRYMVEELVTGGTIWSYLAGKGYNELFGTDFPENKRQQHLAMVLSKTPVVRRFFGVTNPYSKHAAKINEAEEGSIIKKFIENRNFDAKVEGYLYEDSVSRDEVFKEMRKAPDKQTYDRLLDRFKWEEAIKDLPEKAFWRRMKGLNTDAKAKVFVDRLNSSNDAEKDQLWREFNVVRGAGGVISDDLLREIEKQRFQK